MANHISVEHVPAAQDVYEIKVMVDALSDGGYAILIFATAGITMPLFVDDETRYSPCIG